MPRRKRKSSILSEAAKRLSGMRSIDPKLDLGRGYSNTEFQKKIAKVTEDLDAYNTLLSKVDAAYNTLSESEKDLASFSSKMLLKVGAFYDKDSNEYEMAGGSRTSKRKRTARKLAETPEAMPV